MIYHSPAYAGPIALSALGGELPAEKAMTTVERMQRRRRSMLRRLSISSAF